MDANFYLQTLYHLQDRVLSIITPLDTGFYLSGGTAASRAYLHHRFSDDLDFFVSDDERFTLWSERIIQALNQNPDWRTQVLLKEARYVRLNLVDGSLNLKVELINDVPARVGPIRQDAILGRIDSAENILANKVTALLDREEPKDLADIWGFCTKMGLSLDDAINNAQSKAAGVFPADLGRILCSVTEQDWQIIRWQEPAPHVEQFLTQLNDLGEKLLLLK
jgi:hypothetical protein